MDLHTIGFTKKSARQFFEIIKHHSIDLLVDIRLNNKSQLAGFSKGDDLAYFLQEICKCSYGHYVELVPTKKLLDDYKGRKISWDIYEKKYKELIAEREASALFLRQYGEYKSIVLLCSEPTAERCHRRLAAEAIIALDHGISISHL